MAPVARAARTAEDQRGTSPQPPSSQNNTTSNADTVKELPGDGMSWYLRSWPTKSTAVTEVARESISAASAATSQRARSSSSLRSAAKSSRPPSIQLTKKGAVSTRSLPADVATTRVNIASTGISPMPKASHNIVSNVHSGLNPSNDTKKVEDEPKNDEELNRDDELKDRQPQERDTSEQKQDSSHAQTDAKIDTKQKESQNQASRSVGWLEWFSMVKTTNDTVQDAPNPTVTEEHIAGSTTPKVELEDTENSVNVNSHKHDNPTPKENQTSQSRSWLQLWGGTNIRSQAAAPEISPNPQNMKNSTSTPRPNEIEENTSSTQPIDTDRTSQPTEEANHGRTGSVSGWLFWPRQQPDASSTAKKGEYADENAPPDGNTKDQPKAALLAEKVKDAPVSKNNRTKPSTSQPTTSESPTANVPKEPPLQPANVSTTPPTRKGERAPPNQVLPSFQTTFPLENRPSFIEQLSRLIYKKGSEPKHVLRSQATPQVKRAIAIGVHGYFPTPLIRTVIGQPTGTSVKFASMAARAIEEWANENNSTCHIEKIALEGEGRISERVDLLWKLLLNWIEHIREADFVLVSCHSQGVPVATMLVSKLIAFGCVSNARIGICAMAGINLGPFADYRSRWISGSAGELFDFTDAESKVSQGYRAALKAALDFGVKVTYVGSIDDQLVSMESSTFSTVSHPHIYRAVFVDGRVHAPSFLSHLVGFTMKLRNLGVSDHGLIRELSSPLAGSLYTGEGHSRLYEDKNVYKLAIRFALETTVVNNADIQFHTINAPTASTSTANPYILPFAMRGVLEEEYVRHQLSDETTELLKQFEAWKPSTKILKDVKFRLEGIRSKL
ncbi:hypothetical protein MauCBS54593_005450 [Microsporum audouinii]